MGPQCVKGRKIKGFGLVVRAAMGPKCVKGSRNRRVGPGSRELDVGGWELGAGGPGDGGRGRQSISHHPPPGSGPKAKNKFLLF